jgi:hypothetical protein
MMPTEVSIALEVLLTCERGVPGFGERKEQRPRGSVVRRNRGFELLCAAHRVAGEKSSDQRASQAASPGIWPNGDLPDEQRLWFRRGAIGGHPAADLSVLLSENAGVSKVRTLQQIAIERVCIQWRTTCDQFPHCTAVCGRWFAKQVRQISISRFRYGLPSSQLRNASHLHGGLIRLAEQSFIRRSTMCVTNPRCCKTLTTCSALIYRRFSAIAARKAAALLSGAVRVGWRASAWLQFVTDTPTCARYRTLRY